MDRFTSPPAPDRCVSSSRENSILLRFRRRTSSLIVKYLKADGSAIQDKLKIGSKYMNILSVNLHHDHRVDIEPSTSASINSIQPSSTRIFYRQDCVKEFSEAFNNQSYAFHSVSISSLRQCDMPHNEGTSNISTEKIASRFVQALAIAHLNNTPTPDFSTAFATFRAAAKVRKISFKDISKDWGTLATFVTTLEKKLI
ncbi:hypothetical protein BDF20DRAFT_909177 [Mycotypha africana]|uniref:uncharacterized protein n=1 Tax=Mycotypha africana TaxID=64632 RepID=UPI002300E2E7|nr:uncharacterized protein BDF20DRAFT_909177 [Mycotypha africana]KAI8991393.1 hypothetical protein BDF20DRAFT_909177 [Mycotypha africana]